MFILYRLRLARDLGPSLFFIFALLLSQNIISSVHFAVNVQKESRLCWFEAVMSVLLRVCYAEVRTYNSVSH